MPIVSSTTTSTIYVSQPDQFTSNTYYERGQAIVYDGADYYLFYGRSTTVTVPYSSGNPDTHDYEIYFKKASTVNGLAGATPTKLNNANNHGKKGHHANVFVGSTQFANGIFSIGIGGTH